MMIGTSGRMAFALGSSSSPLMPGMLMSDRIKMIDTPDAFGLDRNISDIIHKFGRKAVCLSAVEDSVFLAGNDGLVGIAEPGS